MPTIDELPTKLAPLAKLTAIEIGARQFETDIARLLDDKDLALLLEEKRQQNRRRFGAFAT